MSAVAGFRRRLTLLLQQARDKIQATVNAVRRAVGQDRYENANRELESAFQTSLEAFNIVGQANEVWGQLAAIDPPKGETAFPELVRALQQCAEVSLYISHGREVVFYRLVWPLRDSNAYRNALLTFFGLRLNLDG